MPKWWRTRDDVVDVIGIDLRAPRAPRRGSGRSSRLLARLNDQLGGRFGGLVPALKAAQ